MKNFLKQFTKLCFLVLVVTLLIAGAVSYSLKNKKADNAYAIGSGEAGSIDITGESWSENIGWIRFNGIATNGSPYGVGMKEINGIGRLSGHAWADKDHIGWISFNRSETGNPPASASYDPGLSQSGQPLAYIDADGKCTYVNDRWSDISGMTSEEALGSGWMQVIHPDDNERVVANKRNGINKGLPYKIEYRFLRRDGRVVFVEAQELPLKDADGKMTGYVGTIIDVTERKKADEILRES